MSMYDSMLAVFGAEGKQNREWRPDLSTTEYQSLFYVCEF